MKLFGKLARVFGLTVLALVVGVGYAYSQPRDGQWEGVDREGNPIRFLVASGGTEFQIQSLQKNYHCSRGGEQGWGHGFGGFTTPIDEEGQFEWLYQIGPTGRTVAGQSWAMLVTGIFLDDTSAEGVHEGWLAAFNGRSVLDRRPSAQSCPTGEVPWTAEWVGEVPTASVAAGQVHRPVRLVD